MAKKKRIYNRVEGELIIYYDSKVFIDKLEVIGDDMLHLPVKLLKNIIKNVVADTKAGLWG